MNLIHPLIETITLGNTNEVKEWLDTRGVPTDSAIRHLYNYGLYHYALPHPEMIELLSQYKDIDIEYEDDDGLTALGMFFWSMPFPTYRSKSLTTLLNIGANPNHIDKYGNTPMHWLMQNMDTNIHPRWFRDQLFKHGAYTSYANSQGRTARLIARARNKEYWMDDV